MVSAGVLDLMFLVTRSIEAQNLDALQIMRVLRFGRLFRFQLLEVSHSPMGIVQIAPNMRSFGPVHHTTKVARHVLHMPCAFCSGRNLHWNTFDLVVLSAGVLVLLVTRGMKAQSLDALLLMRVPRFMRHF